MADINKIDITNTQDSLQATYRAHQGFKLTTYSDGTTISLAGGTVEELGDYLYRVEGGDLAITDSGLSNGTVYVHIKDDGDGTASAYLSTNSGTWNANKAGFYYTDGAKVIIAMTKTSPNYTNRGNMLSPLSQERAIGEMFGIHPDTLIKPNPFNFSPCDGVETMDTSFISASNDTKVPLMLNNRFLTGATSWDPDLSGSNSHNHQWHTMSGTSGRTYNSAGAEIATQTSVTGTGLETTSTSDTVVDIEGYTDIIDHKPKYFVVKYFIRIR